MRMSYGLTLSTSLTFPPPAYFPVFLSDCLVTLFTWMAIMIIIWLPSLATSAVVRLTQARGHWRESEQSVISRNSRGLSSMELLSVSSVREELSVLSPALYIDINSLMQHNCQSLFICLMTMNLKLASQPISGKAVACTVASPSGICVISDAHTMWPIKFLIIKPSRCTNFSNLFFGRKLYMFQTVPLSIVRSVSLYTQQCYMSYRFADNSRAVCKPVWHIPLLCVQWNTHDDGQRNCPKHVEFTSKK